MGARQGCGAAGEGCVAHFVRLNCAESRQGAESWKRSIRSQANPASSIGSTPTPAALWLIHAARSFQQTIWFSIDRPAGRSVGVVARRVLSPLDLIKRFAPIAGSSWRSGHEGRWAESWFLVESVGLRTHRRSMVAVRNELNNLPRLRNAGSLVPSARPSWSVPDRKSTV